MTVATADARIQTDDETGYKTWRYGWWNWRFVKYPENREITGFILCGSSRGSIIGYIAVFSTLALIGLGESVQDCATRRIEFGGGASILTSSLVSTALVVEGVLNAIISPIFGALTDSGSKRTLIFKAILVSMAVVLVASGLLLFAEGQLWVLILYAMLLVLLSIQYDAFAILNNSYVPELSEDEIERTLYTTKMYTLLNANQLLYVAMGVGLGLVLGVSNDKIAAPQVGVIVAVLVWAFWALPGMPFMESRVKTEENRIPAGFLGFPRVAKMIYLCATKYTQIGIFMLQYSIGVTGASALVALSTGYFVSEVGLKSFDAQVIIALVLLFSVPGALMVGWIVRKVGDLRKVLLGIMVYWIIMVALVPFLMRGQQAAVASVEDVGVCAFEAGNELTRESTSMAKITRYFFAIVWGFGLGTIYPVNVALFAELCPGASESSFFGLRTFAGKIFSWAPPLLYTQINENVSIENRRFSIMAIVPFLVVGLFFTYLLDMDKAREQIADTLHLRHKNKAAQARAQNGRLSIKDPMNMYDV